MAKYVHIAREASSGKWYAKDRCLCNKGWEPHVARGTFGHRSPKEAAEALRGRRSEERRPGDIDQRPCEE